MDIKCMQLQSEQEDIAQLIQDVNKEIQKLVNHKGL